MGRKGGHADKKARVLNRDFRAGPRADVYMPGTGSEAPFRAAQAGTQPNGKWDISPEGLRNETFEAYYKARGCGGQCQATWLTPRQAQQIVPEGEWEAFMECLRKPLPATFRISGSGKFAAAVRDTLRNDFVSAIAKLVPSDAEGECIAPPFPLPWCAQSGAGAARAGAAAHAAAAQPPPAALTPRRAGTRTRWRGRWTTRARSCASCRRWRGCTSG